MIYTLPTTLIAAVLPAAAKKDVRYYLNGIRLEPGPQARSVATDGHVLLTALASEADYTGPALTLPRDLCEAIAKAKADTFELELGDGLTDQRHRVSIRLGSVTLSGETTGGNYPNWRALMPANISRHATHTQLSGPVVDVLVKAAKLWGKFGSFALVNGPSPESSVSVRFSGKCPGLAAAGGVVMPIRSSHALKIDPSEPLAGLL